MGRTQLWISQFFSICLNKVVSLAGQIVRGNKSCAPFKNKQQKNYIWCQFINNHIAKVIHCIAVSVFVPPSLMSNSNYDYS